MHPHKEGQDDMKQEWRVSDVICSSRVKENGITVPGDQVMTHFELPVWRMMVMKAAVRGQIKW